MKSYKNNYYYLIKTYLITSIKSTELCGDPTSVVHGAAGKGTGDRHGADKRPQDIGQG